MTYIHTYCTRYTEAMHNIFYKYQCRKNAPLVNLGGFKEKKITLYSFILKVTCGTIGNLADVHNMYDGSYAYIHVVSFF